MKIYNEFFYLAGIQLGDLSWPFIGAEYPIKCLAQAALRLGNDLSIWCIPRIIACPIVPTSKGSSPANIEIRD